MFNKFIHPIVKKEFEVILYQHLNGVFQNHLATVYDIRHIISI